VPIICGIVQTCVRIIGMTSPLVLYYFG